MVREQKQDTYRIFIHSLGTGVLDGQDAPGQPKVAGQGKPSRSSVLPGGCPRPHPGDTAQESTPGSLAPKKSVIYTDDLESPATHRRQGGPDPAENGQPVETVPGGHNMGIRKRCREGGGCLPVGTLSISRDVRHNLFHFNRKIELNQIIRPDFMPAIITVKIKICNKKKSHMKKKNLYKN